MDAPSSLTDPSAPHAWHLRLGRCRCTETAGRGLLVQILPLSCSKLWCPESGQGCEEHRMRHPSYVLCEGLDRGRILERQEEIPAG